MAEAGTQSELEQQLQAAREEAELTLEQLHLVQEELEVYFLKAQDLEGQLKAAGFSNSEHDAATKQVESLSKERDKLKAERDQQAEEADQQSELLRTAQRMLEGQARYLEDLSLKEEQAEQAVDQLRLLKQEIRYYIQHSRPSSSLNPDQIQRLIELVKKPTVPLG